MRRCRGPILENLRACVLVLTPACAVPPGPSASPTATATPAATAPLAPADASAAPGEMPAGGAGPTGAASAAVEEGEPVPPTPVYPFHDVLPDIRLPRDAPAIRNANLSAAQCRAEVRRRGLPVRWIGGNVRGIAAPLRLTGPLRGVRFRSPGGKSPYGMLDCRLALTLDDLAVLLEAHQVVEVRVDNMYRPKAHLPGSRKRSQHAYGLAADVTVFGLSEGRTLVVERDFQGTRGEPVCGPESGVAEPTEEAIALRNILCAVARHGLFHHILTPNYNEAHRDHLHLDIKRDEKRRSLN
jgi:hypothetical protein